MPGSLCVVSHLMLPLLAGTDEPVVGGAEVQSYHLAAELVQRGWRLEFLVCAMDGTSSGTRSTPLGPAHTLFARRTVKSLSDKLREKRALFTALRQRSVDLCFQRAHWDTDVAALACRSIHRPFVYGLASDRDVVALPRVSRRRLAIDWATAIVAQTASQRQWTQRYGRDARQIPSGFPVPELVSGDKRAVLWVGTLRALKRPEVFLDLAAAFPDHPFVMCGGPGEDPRLAAQVAARAATLPNLRFLGFVPYRLMAAHFAQARVLVNTSTYEGFPNTFVLAWLHGAVVASLGVDPDQALTTGGLGLVAADPAGLGEALARLLGHDEPALSIAARARAHAERVHDVRQVATQYEELFDALRVKRSGR